MNVAAKVSFDLSLARGLDYYSVLIYEVTSRHAGASQSSQVGSIAAGSRYDSLVGMYGKQPIPCVGLSFGVDRILTILYPGKEKSSPDLTRETDVYIITGGGGKEYDGLLHERMAFKASANGPLTVILGQDELAAGQVRLKVAQQTNHQETEEGDEKGEKD
ncbi:hypothetical protein F4680DRAFT_454756 [Xylaria scruposa]|nr:hypothetical protein F4680DRAFT_454756 [Xylaria scruposa]